MNRQLQGVKRPSADRKMRMSVPLVMPAALLVVLSLACGTGTAQPDAAQMTGTALSAQVTALSLQMQQLTQQAAVPTNTQAIVEPPTASPPTESPPPSESPYMEGSMVRASYDPAAGMGVPEVYEDFEGSSGIFSTFPGGAANSWYGNGQYHITFTTSGQWTWYFGEPGAEDFYADVLVFNGEQCAERDSGGLIFHGNQQYDVVLLFGVTCGGGYYVGYSGGPGPVGMVCTWTGTPDILGPCPKEVSGRNEWIEAGPQALNRLGVMSQGAQFSFYINGHEVDGYISPWTGTFFDVGKFALFLGTGQKDDASVSFDEFSLWRNP